MGNEDYQGRIEDLHRRIESIIEWNNKQDAKNDSLIKEQSDKTEKWRNECSEQIEQSNHAIKILMTKLGYDKEGNKTDNRDGIANYLDKIDKDIVWIKRFIYFFCGFLLVLITLLLVASGTTFIDVLKGQIGL